MILDKNAFGIWSLVAKKAFRSTFKEPEGDHSLLKNSLNHNAEVGIYLHIPFCKSLCPACPYVKNLWDEKLVNSYLEALKQEIRMYGELLSDLGLKVTNIHTGGGTPSLLDPGQYRDILDTLNQCFEVDPEAGFGIEANPQDMSMEKSRGLVEAGVKELSIGVQSFRKTGLKALGRAHSVEDSLEAIENAREAGFDFINIDLMYMLPRETVDDWTQDLEIAAKQDVDEITTYPLLITDFVPMYQRLKGNSLEQQPSKREFKKMFYKTFEVLGDAGFKPLEIYGFSRSGEKYATVNLEMEGPLLGFGSGATGFTGQYEYQNTCSAKEYIHRVMNGGLPIAGERAADGDERIIRWIVSRLFVGRGFDLRDFESEFGGRFKDKVGEFGKALRILKSLGIISSDGKRIELTKRGLFSSNLLIWSFVLHVPCELSKKYMETPWPNEVSIP
ncbi:MAG: coproporphyrinogen-III oxidase family protein [Candidatus Thermoplasmatota archaeon]|nr:coproporphyrinogen-III oxidase family protein [Candidatus Thermoplasmatota archaeon]